jgi:hypothetical protein
MVELLSLIMPVNMITIVGSLQALRQFRNNPMESGLLWLTLLPLLYVIRLD